jgi:hypothetical protein
MAEEKESGKNSGVDTKTEENNAVQEQEVEEEREEQESGEEDEEEEAGDEEAEESAEKEEETPRGPRFDLVEVILYMCLSVISDILDGFWITRFFFAPVIISWLFLKGVSSVGKNVIAQAVELIPGIDWLPITTVAAILTIWSTNSPESFNKTFGIAGKVLKAKKVE